jgi:P pilus assembly chaperone PapD
MRTIKHHNIWILLFILSALSLAPLPVLAAGQLMVAPTRVVFEARDRTAKVSLVNNGTETATYRLEFTRKRMTKDGNFVDVDKPVAGELFCDEMIRFSPRQVTLPPGQSQTIRLILRKPANLAAGEYRSHLLFKSIPKSQSSSIEALDNKKADKLTIELTPVLGISIPVIVRHGKTEVTVSIDNIVLGKAQNNQPAIQFSLKRSGNQSVYGDLSVSFEKSDGQTITLSKANGISVYSPNTERIVALPLYVPKGVQIKGGNLLVTYKLPAEQGSGLIAKQSLAIP